MDFEMFVQLEESSIYHILTSTYFDGLFLTNGADCGIWAGCCRALLCRRGTEDQLRVIQLTADHNLDNDDELKRLSQLGIDAEKVRWTGRLAGHFYTRSIGDFHIKNDYRDIDMIRWLSDMFLLAEFWFWF